MRLRCYVYRLYCWSLVSLLIFTADIKSTFGYKQEDNNSNRINQVQNQPGIEAQMGNHPVHVEGPSGTSSKRDISENEQVVHYFKRHLLSRMGRKERPIVKNSGRQVQVPDILKVIYNQRLHENSPDDFEEEEVLVDDHTMAASALQDTNWDTARAFIAESLDNEASSSSMNTLTFNLSTWSSDEEVEGAQLALLLIRTDSHKNVDNVVVENSSSTKASESCYLRITVSENVRNHTNPLDNHQADCSTESVGRIGGRQWLTFDVSRAVRHWLRNAAAEGREFISGRLTVDWRSRTGAERTCRLQLSSNSAENLSSSPTLIVYTAAQAAARRRSASILNSRPKRNALRHQRGQTTGGDQTTKEKKKRKRKNRKNDAMNVRRSGACSRHEMQVDFDVVGWNDWIVAPKFYDAYYCMGDCSWPLSPNATNHAIIQSLVHSVNPAAVPLPHCAPTDLGPVQMLYVDEYNKILLKIYEDMVVLGCGCK